MAPYSDEDLAAVARHLPPPPKPESSGLRSPAVRYADFENREVLTRTHYSVTSKAWDPVRKATIVIKEIHADRMIMRHGAEQFRAEFQRVAQLSGPNIVPPLVPHLDEPPYFFTMPFIDGEHLDEYYQNRNLSVRQIVEHFLEVCGAVRQAHEGGVIHCDLKPGNILVDRNGKPRLIDFGLGHFLSDLDEEAVPTSGTLEYMAPEQFDGRISVRTDVYALGVILFKLLCGEVPFRRSPDMRLAEYRDHVRTSPVPQMQRANCRIPRELEAIVRKALSRDPACRYESVDRLSDDLRAWLSSRPVSAVGNTVAYCFSRWVRRNWAAVSICVCLAAVASIWLSSVWRVSVARRIGLHQAAIESARRKLDQDDHLVAKAELLHEAEQFDDRQTRYAMWEYFRKYPCLVHNENHRRLNHVVVSPDNRWIVAAGSNGEAYVYSLETGQEVEYGKDRDVFLLAGQACSLAFLPNGMGLATGNKDGTIHIWKYDAHGAVPFGDRPDWTIEGMNGAVTCMAFDSSHTRLAAGTDAGLLYCIRKPLDDSYIIEEELSGLGVPKEIQWFPDETPAFACAVHKNLPTDDIAAGLFLVYPDRKHVSVIHFAIQSARSVDFFSEKRLAIGSDHVQVYRLDDLLAAVRTDKEHGWEVIDPGDVSFALWEDSQNDQPTWAIRSLAVQESRIGSFFAYAGGNGVLRGEMIPRLSFGDSVPDVRRMGYHETGSGVDIDLAFSSDGRRLVSVSMDGLRIWGVPFSYEIGPVAQGEWVTPLGSNTGGYTLASNHVNDEGRLLPWQEPAFAMARQGGVNTTVVSVITLDGEEDPGFLRQMIVGPFGEDEFAGEEKTLTRGSLSPDGRFLTYTDSRRISEKWYSRQVLVSNGQDGTPRLSWVDNEQGTKTNPPVLWIPGNPMRFLCGMIDGRMLVYWIDDAGRIDPNPETFHAEPSSCSYVTRNQDGNRLAASWDDGTIHLWKQTEQAGSNELFADQWRLERTIHAEAEVWWVTFVEEDNGRELLACGGSSNSIALYDPASGGLIGTLDGHSNAIWKGIGYPDFLGAEANDSANPPVLLVTTSRDRTIRIWDVTTRVELATLAETRTDVTDELLLFGEDAIVYPDGNRIMMISPESFRESGRTIH